ncbi:MAG: hypothetical protein K2M93_00840 [Muribaculaceae bacterium]|nr:hypothetical protein [Muribaculaceae bacterium]
MAAGKPCRKNYREIFEEWHAEFPFLERYSPTTMYERVGPFMMGLRLERDEDDEDKTGYSNYYRLFYEIVPLWITDPKLWGASFMDELRIERRKWFRKVSRQAWVQYWRHDLLFEETLKAAKAQYRTVIGPTIRLVDMVDFIEAAYKRSHDNISSIRFKLELGLGVYLNNEALINEVWRKIEEVKCDVDRFEYRNGFGYDDWVNKMHEFAGDRAGLMANIEQNCTRPRIARLNVGEFTEVEDYRPKTNWRDRLSSLFSKA